MKQRYLKQMFQSKISTRVYVDIHNANLASTNSDDDDDACSGCCFCRKCSVCRWYWYTASACDTGSDDDDDVDVFVVTCAIFLRIFMLHLNHK